MRRIACTALLCSLIGCSSGGESSGFTTAQRLTIQCARVTVLDVVRILGQSERILNGDVPLTPDSGNRFDYSLTFDDTTMSGTVTFPRDPADGIPLGEDVTISFLLDGPLRGSGTVILNFANASRASVRGGATMENVEADCSSSLIFLPALPLTVVFGSLIADSPAPAAEVFGMNLWGPMSATVTSDGGTRFSGDLDLAPAMQEMQIAGAVNGEEFRTVISLFPTALERQQLADCVTAIGAMRTELFGILSQLTGAIDDAGADLTTLPEIPGFTIVPVSPSNATYLIDLTAFGSLFTGGTVRGSVRLTRINFETTGFWSWRLDGEIGEETAVGQSARFYEIAVGASGVRSTGEGTLGRLDCKGTFNENESLVLRGVVGEHALEIEFDDQGPIAARINGVPVPLDAVLPR